jgi:hypothetical protein
LSPVLSNGVQAGTQTPLSSDMALLLDGRGLARYF